MTEGAKFHYKLHKGYLGYTTTALSDFFKVLDLVDSSSHPLGFHVEKSEWRVVAS
jgi:hypothetical protein